MTHSLYVPPNVSSVASLNSSLRLSLFRVEITGVCFVRKIRYIFRLLLTAYFHSGKNDFGWKKLQFLKMVNRHPFLHKRVVPYTWYMLVPSFEIQLVNSKIQSNNRT